MHLYTPVRELLAVARRQGTLGASNVSELLDWSLVDKLALITNLEKCRLVRILPGNMIESC